jgi:hypothetical protein
MQILSSPEFLIWKKQRQKYIRKKRWRKKKRSQTAESRRKENDIKNRAIDEWIQRKEREDKLSLELARDDESSPGNLKRKKKLIQKLKLMEQLRQSRKAKNPSNQNFGITQNSDQSHPSF